MANKEEEKILKITVKYDDALDGIKKYKKELVDLAEEESNLKATDEDYADKLELINAKRKEAQAEIRALRKEIQNNIKIQKQQEGSLKQLRAALSNATKAYDEMSREERNSAKGEELKNHIKEITAELKGAEEETERFYRNVGNYKNSILEAIGVNGGFADSLMEMSEGGEGIKGALTNAADSVKAFGKALLGLLTNPVFLALAGIAGVGVAFKWFYDYNKGIEEATRKTRALFKEMSSDDLKKFRSDIQAIADLYNKEFQEVLIAVNSLVKQFGIEGKDATELIAHGFALNADIDGEFLAYIEEFSAQFKAAGLSAKEFIAITTDLSSQGVFGNKALDSIKEATIRLREMPQATRDALESIGFDVDDWKEKIRNGEREIIDFIREISKRLTELGSDSDKVGTVIADVFGGAGEDAGFEFLKYIKDATTNMGQLKEEAGQFYDINMRIYESEKSLNEELAKTFDITDGGFESITGEAEIFLNYFLAGIVKALGNIRDFLLQINDTFKTFKIASSVWGTFYELLLAVYNTCTGILSTIKLIFTWDVKTWADEWNSAGARISNNFADIWTTWTTGWEKAEKRTLEGMDKVVEKAQSVKKKVGWGNWLKGIIDDNSKAKTKDGIEAEIKELERLANRFDFTAQAAEKLSAAIKARKEALASLGSGGKKPLKDEIVDEYDARKQEIEERAKIIAEKLRLLKLGIEDEYKLKLEQLELEKQQRQIAISEEYEDESRRKTALLLLDIDFNNKRKALIQQRNAEIKAQAENVANEILEKNKQFFDNAFKQSQAWTQADIKRAEDKAKKEEEIERKRNSALMGLSSAMSAFARKAAEENEELAGVAKALAIAEVLIAQGVAIANAVKNATKSGATVWDTIALIGVAIGAVTSVMSTAMDSINSANVGSSSGSTSSAGGVVYSSSAVYNPMLEQMNGLGNNLTTQTSNTQEQINEEMMTDAMTRSAKAQPAPVVSVVEITEAQERVRIIQNIGSV